MKRLAEKEEKLRLKEKEIKVMEKIIVKLLSLSVVLPLQIVAFFLIAKGQTLLALIIALLMVFIVLFLLYLTIKPRRTKRR